MATVSGEGSTFSASSWTQLTLTLCSVEKEIGVIRLKADETVGKKAERVRMVTAKRREMEAKHDELVEERVAEYNAAVESLNVVADREIAEHTVKKDKADARIETARCCAEKAEAYAKELEKQVKALYRKLDEAHAESERRLATLRRESDHNVERKLEESDQLVRDTGLYASEVQAGVINAMSDMEAETRRQIRGLEQVSKSQSRFKELYDMSRARTSGMPEAEFKAATGDVLEAWHDSWLMVARSGVKSPDSPGFSSLSLPTPSRGSPCNLFAAEDILDTVTHRVAASPSPLRPERSKERALSRAAEHQFRRPRSIRQEVGELRPRTAP